jgi:hypothetical protein
MLIGARLVFNSHKYVLIVMEKLFCSSVKNSSPRKLKFFFPAKVDVLVLYKVKSSFYYLC